VVESRSFSSGLISSLLLCILIEYARDGKMEMQLDFLLEIHSEKVKLILVFVLILVDFDAGNETSTSGPALSSGPPFGEVRLAQEKICRARKGNNNNNCFFFIS